MVREGSRSYQVTSHKDMHVLFLYLSLSRQPANFIFLTFFHCFSFSLLIYNNHIWRDVRVNETMHGWHMIIYLGNLCEISQYSDTACNYSGVMFHWILLSRLKCIILLKSKHGILFISGKFFEICQLVLTTNSASFYFQYVIHLNLLILIKVSLFFLYRWIDLTDNRCWKPKPATSATETSCVLASCITLCTTTETSFKFPTHPPSLLHLTFSRGGSGTRKPYPSANKAASVSPLHSEQLGRCGPWSHQAVPCLRTDLIADCVKRSRVRHWRYKLPDTVSKWVAGRR